MTNLSAFNGRLAGRIVAAASVIVLASLSVGACAQTLGIEDTTLAASDEARCLEPIIPYFWYFSQPITSESSFPLRVVPQASWEGIVTSGFQLPYEPDKGHIVADVRDCTLVKDVGNPAGPLVPAQVAGVRFEFRPPSGTETSNFFFGMNGTPEPILRETSTFSLGGIISASEGFGPFVALPRDLDGPSSKRTIRVRAGFLTTLRNEPNGEVGRPTGEVPDHWNCVGKVPPPASAATPSTDIVANVSNLSTGAPAPGIRFRVCGANNFDCDLSDDETPDATTGADGVARIPVPTPGGAPWAGYLVVRGKVRKSGPECNVAP